MYAPENRRPGEDNIFTVKWDALLQMWYVLDPEKLDCRNPFGTIYGDVWRGLAEAPSQE
jgi:hypothetical protein